MVDQSETPYRSSKFKYLWLELSGRSNLMDPIIVADDVCVNFRRGLLGPKIRALRGLSLEVREGDFFALVGQNGAGKSTAMYCLLGLLAPSSGRVQVMGRTPQLGASLYESVGYLPEEPQYDLYLTVEEAVRYYASLYGRGVSAQAVDAALDRLGLSPFRKLPLSKCSKGMKQKAGLAQCLIHETKLLFLDEPTRGLDPIVVRQLRDVLCELHQRGATLVMNSHVLSEVEMMANRVAIIDAGKVIAQDDIGNLTRINEDRYEVTFESARGAPEFADVRQRQGQTLKAVIPKERLHDFMEFARQDDVKLLECSLQKTSLEESFLSIIRGGSEPQSKGEAPH